MITMWNSKRLISKSEPKAGVREHVQHMRNLILFQILPNVILFETY